MFFQPLCWFSRRRKLFGVRVLKTDQRIELSDLTEQKQPGGVLKRGRDGRLKRGASQKPAFDTHPGGGATFAPPGNAAKLQRSRKTVTWHRSEGTRR